MEYRYLKHNAKHLEQELDWLGTIVSKRVAAWKSGKLTVVSLLPLPHLKGPVSVYKKFLSQFELDEKERLILILALQPHISPGYLENKLAESGVEPARFAELGCVKTSHYSNMLPTGETVLFLLAGRDIESRIRASLYFSPQHKFLSKNILKLDEVANEEPETAGTLCVSKDVLYLLTSGTQWQPHFNTHFPAKQITTPYSWKDLVLNPETLAQINEIKDWLEYRNTLLHEWGFSKHTSGGYKCLFYGPPGTGKSLATMVLGKQYELPVYRVDLSMVISKYIGETEKNLSNVFDAAAGKDWILFFDEADSLFGKRTNIQNANDRFANQEVSYLLMRMEEYTGLAILATNLRSNIDKAFMRRFQSVVYFNMPEPARRLQIWEQGLPAKATLDKNVNIRQLADTYTLSGANIINIIRYCSIRALKAGDKVITHEYLLEGIRRELAREAGMTGD